MNGKKAAWGRSAAGKRKGTAGKRKATWAKTKTTAAKGRASSRKPRPQATAKRQGPETEPRREAGVTVVGIGASAGGLEAFTELLAHLPPDLGMAFVFIQHLDPQHKSNLVEILSRSTQMPVEEAADGMPLKPAHVYVMPAAMDITVFHGVLNLMPRPARTKPHLPVDHFLRALAEDQGARAIGIILSGTGSDGSVGMRAVKAAGGITMVQDQKTAKYSGMPHSAAATPVDFVLQPKDMVRELVRIGRHPWLEPAKGRPSTGAGELAPESLQKVFLILRSATGVDFADYKRSTVERRICRRMVLHKIDKIEHYVRLLQETPGEVGALFEDMLISVTGFFRDPATFEALEKKVLPAITENRAPKVPIRVWVVGCSTGEEVYSIAICLLEHCDKQQIGRPVQIFATDVSDAAIDTARAGHYPQSIAADVSAQRLRRFFTKSDSGYQVNKIVRDVCIFAKQDVTKDPPFSKLDLISCRNLLIYLDTPLQKRVIPVLHYALTPKGFLMLGSSETIGEFSNLFSLADRKHKIYAKKAAAARPPWGFGTVRLPLVPEMPKANRAAARPPPEDLHKAADRIVLARYGPSGVVVNDELEIVHFRGQVGRYLEPAPGAASFKLLKMARADLVLDLRAAIAGARKAGAPVRKEGVRVRHNRQMVVVNLEVIPVKAAAGGRHFLVLFEEAPAQGPAKKAAVRPAPARGRRRAGAADEELRTLREELAATKASLQGVIEEHEATDEEIRAANEEIQSSNEELQSTNEELETAKEELQSTNEELTTLIEELENRNVELARAGDDLTNVLKNAEIPMVMLGPDLCIRSTTPAAESVLNIRAGDVGRPIGELKLGVEVPGLEETVSDAMRSLEMKEQEATSRDGSRRYFMRVRPYRTADDRIDGVLIALIDLTERMAARAAQEARIYAESIVDTVREPLVVLDGDLRVVSASRSFYTAFNVSPGETTGQMLYELGNRQWDIPALRELLEDVLPEKSAFDDFRVEHDFPGIGRRTMLLNARQIHREAERSVTILLAIEDITHDEKR